MRRYYKDWFSRNSFRKYLWKSVWWNNITI